MAQNHNEGQRKRQWPATDPNSSNGSKKARISAAERLTPETPVGLVSPSSGDHASESSHVPGCTAADNKPSKQPRHAGTTHLLTPATGTMGTDEVGDSLGDYPRSSTHSQSPPPPPPPPPPPHTSSAPQSDDPTQPTQLSHNRLPLSSQVKDEVEEGVWGYLMPYSSTATTLVLRTRTSCASGSGGEGSPPSGGYLIGRDPECDIVLQNPVISQRHCLVYQHPTHHDMVAMVEDLSSNGLYLNNVLVGKNQRREINDRDELALPDHTRYVFRYPEYRYVGPFLQKYQSVGELGRGTFATVYQCIEKATGQRWAVKRFDKHRSQGNAMMDEALQQEIAVLMSVSHPNVLCIKETFNEARYMYVVLELAPAGELFDYITSQGRLTEQQARHVFKQLFSGIKYLHDRNIVHRDIKPENILLQDEDLTVKIGDFGLAKFVGEQSFTTTLCGTPEYTAPEVLSRDSQRGYTRAVDIWSMGVVLYACLGGYPPFSNGHYHPVDFPYTMREQILEGKFAYDHPLWEHISEEALDLIDGMLTVDPTQRLTIDECLSNPWLNMTESSSSTTKSITASFVGGMADLGVNKNDTGGTNVPPLTRQKTRRIVRPRNSQNSLVRVSQKALGLDGRGDSHGAYAGGNGPRLVLDQIPESKVNNNSSMKESTADPAFGNSPGQRPANGNHLDEHHASGNGDGPLCKEHNGKSPEPRVVNSNVT